MRNDNAPAKSSGVAFSRLAREAKDGTLARMVVSRLGEIAWLVAQARSATAGALRISRRELARGAVRRCQPDGERYNAGNPPRELRPGDHGAVCKLRYPARRHVSFYHAAETAGGTHRASAQVNQHCKAGATHIAKQSALCWERRAGASWHQLDSARSIRLFCECPNGCSCAHVGAADLTDRSELAFDRAIDVQRPGQACRLGRGPARHGALASSPNGDVIDQLGKLEASGASARRGSLSE